MKRKTVLGGAIMLVTAMGMTVWGQNEENTKKFDSQESAFLRQAAQEDTFEQRIGQYAAEHAATDAVRELGRQMSTDHHSDLAKLEQMAQDHGLVLMGHDEGLTPQEQTIYNQLTSKSGKDFDKDYTKLMVARHNEQIAIYTREHDHAADVAVRDYADKGLSMLKDHLKMAEHAQSVAWGT
jgi:putative membrane protein